MEDRAHWISDPDAVLQLLRSAERQPVRGAMQLAELQWAMEAACLVPNLRLLELLKLRQS